MDFIVTITEPAEEDLREVFLWYESKRVGLGERFKDIFENTIYSLKSNPFKFQIRYSNIRIRFLKKFPFGIHYTIVENEIIIYGVFHTSQDPSSWKRE